MELVRVGSQGLITSRLALGCMGMSEFYVGRSDADSEATVHEAVAQGITMFDTADMYGPFTNERLVGACLAPYRAHVAIATKFGYVRRPDGTRLGISGRPEYVKSACEGSLLRLHSDYIDLYYLHRVDRTVPIEDTVGAMAELVLQGKVRYLGLSEVSSRSLRRAHAVFPISAVQSEYSLISRDPELDLFGTLRELGIGFVAYAPLGRGLLTGRFRHVDDIPPHDYRRTTPRFSSDNLRHNVLLIIRLQQLAVELNVTPAQLALAWVRKKVSGGVLLVGTTNPLRLVENVRSSFLELDDSSVVALDELFHPNAVHGDRYPDMSRVNV
jgi:aryl-alcohol dehydrogenase-like predicted oxidoreductase